MTVHAHAIRARAVSRQQEQEQNTVSGGNTDLVFAGDDRARQRHLNRFLCELASPELVGFMQERERKLKQRH